MSLIAIALILACVVFQVENYAYGLKHAVEDKKTEDKFSAEDRTTILDAVKEVETWIQEKGDNAEKEEYEVTTTQHGRQDRH